MNMTRQSRNSDKQEQDIDFVDQGIERKENRRTRLRDVLDGSLLTRDKVVKQLPYVLFLTGLLILYIGNRYHAEKVIRKNIDLQSELKELRAEAISTASELEFLSRQTQVARLVEQRNLGLIQSEVPPAKIVVKKRKRKNVH